MPEGTATVFQDRLCLMVRSLSSCKVNVWGVFKNDTPCPHSGFNSCPNTQLEVQATWLPQTTGCALGRGTTEESLSSLCPSHLAPLFFLLVLWTLGHSDSRT